MLTFPIIIYFHFLIDWQNMHRQTAIQNMYKKIPNSTDYASHRQENDKECDETHWKYTSKCICTYRDKEEGATACWSIQRKTAADDGRPICPSTSIYECMYIHIYICMYTLYQESNWIAFQCNAMKCNKRSMVRSQVQWSIILYFAQIHLHHRQSYQPNSVLRYWTTDFAAVVIE